ncbi:hypothetical protein KUT57_00025 [Pseudomonas aeruginosa]|nr:hypothetical protein [Pseudomonas aeruginosa]HBO3622332.1 hypothetical protein [Pseudomonas aeruginosa]HCF5590915.1 hypothetical protein [Pseudomonas aeruginosa]
MDERCWAGMEDMALTALEAIPDFPAPPDFIQATESQACRDLSQLLCMIQNRVLPHDHLDLPTTP